MKTTRRNFLASLFAIPILTALGIRKKPLTRTKNWIIIRNGHTIEFWNDGEKITGDESPFEYNGSNHSIRLKKFWA